MLPILSETDTQKLVAALVQAYPATRNRIERTVQL